MIHEMITAEPVFFREPAQRATPTWPLFVGILVGVLGVAAAVYTWHGQTAATARAVENAPVVHFVPGDDATTALVNQLNAAKRTIHMQAYSFTSAPIAKALVDAEKRGVDVVAVLDKSNKTANYSSADFLAHEGVPTFIDAKHAIAHNKVMIIDGGIVITGSFNFTKAAQESNAENLLVLRDAALAARYEQNWNLHRAHSDPYAGR
jgi:phosphatidylserine/phosphatidylglycerophosphate/cardiolipin synthase-like enzyme